MVTFEVCVEGVDGAVGAEAGGADRIELCAGLVEGGTTPSFGVIGTVLDRLSVPTVVLIRPRGGDFLYSQGEMEALLRDVEAVRNMGAFGIATGVLTSDGRVDTEAMLKVMEAAGDLSVTFHRAFDMTRDPSEALETLAQLGVHRILTSGQERSAPEGLPVLRELATRAGNRISVMPGGGIKEENVRRVIEVTGVREIHFTASSAVESPMVHRNTRPRMGGDRVPGEFERTLPEPEKVARMRSAALSEG